jgi:branched-chain amino acid transport system ATP-binding protein
MTPVLKATGVSVSFGGVHAVVDVDLDVGPGQLVGLIGPNGAGKTTFIDGITGFVRSRGRVELDGRDLTGLPPHARARLGLVRTWQSIELFDDLSVRENLLVASHRPSVVSTLKETVATSRSGSAEIEPTLELLDLRGIADELPSELSQGQRKLVGIARALVAQPHVVCLDEPAAGLDTGESEELGRRLRTLVDGGQAMLLVDHDMGLVLGICDEVVVLEFGKVIARGAPDVVRRDPRVVAAYLGRAASELAPGALESAAANVQEAVSEGDRG